jgi:hypothetical protein
MKALQLIQEKGAAGVQELTNVFGKKWVKAFNRFVVTMTAKHAAQAENTATESAADATETQAA